MVSEKLTSHIEPPPISSRRYIRCQGASKGRKMTLWNRAEGTIDLERNEGKRIMEGEASSQPDKGKEIMDDSHPEEEHSPSPAIRTQMVLPVKEFPHFEGTKREDVITLL